MIFVFNIRKVPRELLKTEGFRKVPRELALGFQHLPRDLVNVNEWKIMFDPYIEKYFNIKLILYIPVVNLTLTLQCLYQPAVLCLHSQVMFISCCYANQISGNLLLLYIYLQHHTSILSLLSQRLWLKCAHLLQVSVWTYRRIVYHMTSAWYTQRLIGAG